MIGRAAAECAPEAAAAVVPVVLAVVAIAVFQAVVGPVLLAVAVVPVLLAVAVVPVFQAVVAAAAVGTLGIRRNPVGKVAVEHSRQHLSCQTTHPRRHQ